MLTVDEMISRILKAEGGFQKWPKDRGNWLNGQLIGTNRGVTPADLASHRGVASITEDDMRRLTEREARDIFRKRYYDAFRIGWLPDELEPAVFDFCVNSGNAGIKALQRTLTVFGHPCAADGELGMETVRQCYNAWQEVPHEILVRAYMQERRAFLERIIEKRPDQRVFLDGWISRVDKLEREVLRDLASDLRQSA